MCSFKLKMYQNLFFGRGSAPDSTGGAYDALPDPIISWGGGALPIPIPFDAFGVFKRGPCQPGGPRAPIVLRRLCVQLLESG